MNTNPFSQADQNKSYVGATVTYPDGSAHVVTDAGVASHPGDEGMALIGQAVYSALK